MHQRAPREEAAAAERAKAPQPVAAPALDGPAAILFLQSTAGNAAVARSLIAREPAAPGVDHGGGTGDVTISLVLRDFNLPKSREGAPVDFLHEPGVSVKIAPEQAPKPVVEAAINAMNVHLQRHGEDLVELSAGLQASAGGEDGPKVGAQAQAEIHVSATFSMTASTSVETAGVDVHWSPFSLGVLYKIGEGAEQKPEKGQGSEYYAKLTAGADVIRWVAAQIDRSELTPAGGGEPLEAGKLVTDLFDAMVVSKGAEATFNADLGLMAEPAGLDRALARAATLIARARPDLARIQTVRLGILKLPPDGAGPSRAVRFKQLAVGGGEGSRSGASSLGGTRVLPAPPPLRGLPKEAPAAPAPRTWGAAPAGSS